MAFVESSEHLTYIHQVYADADHRVRTVLNLTSEGVEPEQIDLALVESVVSLLNTSRQGLERIDEIREWQAKHQILIHPTVEDEGLDLFDDFLGSMGIDTRDEEKDLDSNLDIYITILHARLVVNFLASMQIANYEKLPSDNRVKLLEIHDKAITMWPSKADEQVARAEIEQILSLAPEVITAKPGIGLQKRYQVGHFLAAASYMAKL